MIVGTEVQKTSLLTRLEGSASAASARPASPLPSITDASTLGTSSPPLPQAPRLDPEPMVVPVTFGLVRALRQDGPWTACLVVQGCPVGGPGTAAAYAGQVLCSGLGPSVEDSLAGQGLSWEPGPRCSNGPLMLAMPELSSESPQAPPLAPWLRPGEDHPDILAFLSERHQELARDPSRATTQQAFDTAERLRAQGAEPVVIALLDPEHIGGYIGQWISKKISPALYRGTVEWSGHTACCANGKVYDPLLGAPVNQADYSRKAFGKDLKVVEMYDARALRAVLERRRTQAQSAHLNP